MIFSMIVRLEYTFEHVTDLILCGLLEICLSYLLTIFEGLRKNNKCYKITYFLGVTFYNRCEFGGMDEN